MRWIPGIRMIGLNGSLATGTWHKGSDIDFLLAVAPGRIFTVRALSLLCTQLLGLRRKGGSIAGKVCMNWYLTTDNLLINPQNTYCARTYHNLIPLLDDGKTYAEYRQVNSWMADFGLAPTLHKPVFSLHTLDYAAQAILGLVLGQWFERFVERRQTARVAKDTRRLIPGSVVNVSARELRFHLTKEGRHV